jgi:hypothetical protein
MLSGQGLGQAPPTPPFAFIPDHKGPRNEKAPPRGQGAFVCVAQEKAASGQVGLCACPVHTEGAPCLAMAAFEQSTLSQLYLQATELGHSGYEAGNMQSCVVPRVLLRKDV